MDYDTNSLDWAIGSEGCLRGNHFLDPKLVKYDSDPTINRLRRSNDAMRAYADGTKRLFETKSLRRTAHDQYVLNSEKADARLRACIAQSTEAAAQGNAELGRLEGRIADKLGLNGDGKAGAELRAIYRAKSDQDRLSGAMQGAERGDAELMAALLCAHHEASGLTIEQVAIIRARYIELHGGDLLEYKKALELALEHASRGAVAALNLYETNFPKGKVDAIKASERDYSDALTFGLGVQH